MPYGLRKENGKWVIYRRDTGKVVGTSDSQEKARSSIRARLAGEHGWKPTKGGKK